MKKSGLEPGIIVVQQSALLYEPTCCDKYCTVYTVQYSRGCQLIFKKITEYIQLHLEILRLVTYFYSTICPEFKFLNKTEHLTK